MEYFLQFHWWYILVGIALFFIIFGKKKGGLVASRLTVDFEIVDNRFNGCKPEADYTTFTNDGPDHIDIEIERLPLNEGEDMEFLINGVHLANVIVKRNKEAEFDHWADEDINFPVIHENDELVVIYENTEVLKGSFQFNR